jgi:hypothetical protein
MAEWSSRDAPSPSNQRAESASRSRPAGVLLNYYSNGYLGAAISTLGSKLLFGSDEH